MNKPDIEQDVACLIEVACLQGDGLNELLLAHNALVREHQELVDRFNQLVARHGAVLALLLGGELFSERQYESILAAVHARQDQHRAAARDQAFGYSSQA